MLKINVASNVFILKKKFNINITNIILYTSKIFVKLNKPLHFLITIFSFLMLNYFNLCIFSYKFNYVFYLTGSLI